MNRYIIEVLTDADPDEAKNVLTAAVEYINESFYMDTRLTIFAKDENGNSFAVARWTDEDVAASVE